MKTNENRLSLSKVRITKLTKISTIKGGGSPNRSDRPDCPTTITRNTILLEG